MEKLTDILVLDTNKQSIGIMLFTIDDTLWFRYFCFNMHSVSKSGKCFNEVQLPHSEKSKLNVKRRIGTQNHFRRNPNYLKVKVM